MRARSGWLIALVLLAASLALTTTLGQTGAGGANESAEDPNETVGVNVTEPLFEAPSFQGETLLVVTFLITATLVLGASIWGLGTAFETVSRRISRWSFRELREFKVGAFRIRSAHWLANGIRSAVRLVHLGLVVLLFLLYIPFVLSLFRATEGLYQKIMGLVAKNLDAFLDSFVAYLPNLIFILLVVLVTAGVLRLIRSVFGGIADGAISLKGFYPSWGRPTYAIVRVIVIAFVLVIILPRLPGFGSEAFQGISVFVGALVALGASGAMANVVSGAVLTYTRAFSVGDRVEIASTLGDVVERSLLVTRIRTNRNEDVTIPNAEVLSSHIINYSGLSKERPLILETSVSIGYDVPWRRVHELLIEAGTGCEGVLEEPEPFVLQTALGDFAVSYELRVYTDLPGAMARLRSRLNERIRDAFAEAGVEILSPDHLALREHAPAATEAPSGPATSQPGTEPGEPPTPEPEAGDEEVATEVTADAGKLSEEEQARAKRSEREAEADKEAEEAWAEDEEES